MSSNTIATAAPFPGDDPFNPEALRLSQDFASEIAVKKALVAVPVRRPDRQWFIRVRPGEDYRIPIALLELREEGETYLVDPALREELAGEIAPKLLLTAINRQGALFLWPIRLPGEDGKLDPYNQSALKAAGIAETRWIRLKANRSLGAYDVLEAQGDFPKPEWPDYSFKTLLEIAFQERFIRSLDHPVIRRLRGQS